MNWKFWKRSKFICNHSEEHHRQIFVDSTLYWCMKCQRTIKKENEK